MRTITKHSWSYNGLDTSEEMTALVGVGVSPLDAMGRCLAAARTAGWNLAGIRINQEQIEAVARVQGQDQEEQFIATLFLSDQDR